MIQEVYVSFEIAKLLREKGFPQDPKICNTAYTTKGKFSNNAKSFVFYYESIKPRVCYIAPTQQMAMQWLREKYNIYISIQPDFPSNKDYKMCWCWSANILHENCIITKGHQCYVETYEEAVESAIKYCLENFV